MCIKNNTYRHKTAIVAYSFFFPHYFINNSAELIEIQIFVLVCTVNIYRYKAIGANATSSVILYTGKCISPYTFVPMNIYSVYYIISC